MTDKIEVVAFDADDTLWENELYFQEFEHKFCDLLKVYQPSATVSQELFKTEMKNLHMYGYGLKSMMLSMIETACRITDGTENMHCVEEIIKLGQELLQKPVTLLDGVEDVLLQLQGKYKLVLATKGDLFETAVSPIPVYRYPRRGYPLQNTPFRYTNALMHRYTGVLKPLIASYIRI